MELELDETFSLDGMVDLDALKFGNKLFDIRLSDLNRNIRFGSLQALISKV